MVFEGHEPGGQLSLTSVVENYPGFPEGIGGYDLIDAMKKQAQRFGASYQIENVESVDLGARPFQLLTNSGKNSRRNP